MRNPGGYGVLSSPVPSKVQFEPRGDVEHVSAGIFETDTFSCFHCSRVVRVKPKMDPADMGGLCKLCMKHICKHCVGKACVPFEKKLERMEARERVLRSYGF